MIFEDALRHLRSGQSIRRKSWPTKDNILSGDFNDSTVDQWISVKVIYKGGMYVMLADILMGPKEKGENADRIKRCFVYGLPTNSMMADDWEVV